LLRIGLMAITVLLNARAGSVGTDADAKARELREAFAAVGLESEVLACEPARLAQTARRAAEAGSDLIVAAGGDGTVSAVAGGLVGSDVPLAVLPLGTLNHFAKDLGMPLELGEAVKAIAARQVQRIDVAEVNGRVFINNSSIGLYPEVVMSREEQQKQQKRSKWWAFFIAALRVLRRFPLLAMRLITHERSVSSKTPFVFVGNNQYVVEVLKLGTRTHLNKGHLGLYTVRCTGRFKMFTILMRAIVGKLDAVEDFEAVTVREAWIDVPKRKLPVAVDGEVVMMKSPLHYRIRASALSVVVGTRATNEEAQAS
jgi:diacylglycerol kinase family enzyme